MNDCQNPTPPNLVSTTLDLLRLVRQLREQQAGFADALHAALDLVAQRDAALDRIRAENIHLRAQIRAAISGRTIAEERQQIEDEPAHIGGKAA